MKATTRFDKRGRRLDDTGRGCGCRLCAETNAARYERRREPRPGGGVWNPLHRMLASTVLRRRGPA